MWLIQVRSVSLASSGTSSALTPRASFRSRLHSVKTGQTSPSPILADSTRIVEPSELPEPDLAGVHTLAVNVGRGLRTKPRFGRCLQVALSTRSRHAGRSHPLQVLGSHSAKGTGILDRVLVEDRTIGLLRLLKIRGDP